ncbi:MAG: hypothetical protein KF894_16605 [Labilithrix sp.]|nr:hypothetical protein [Labilithrix sp.]
MRKGVLVVAPIAVTAAIIAACGAERRSAFDPTGGNDAGFEGSQGFTPDQTPCEGLECKIVDCKGGETTTLRGKVYDPAGSNPLYNVMVYIPGGNDPENLPPMKDSTVEPDGIACETCESVIVNPLRSALTDGKGEFVLEDVPVDKDVPVVIQVGKWRRLLHVDVTKQCEENKVADKTLKLPKNGEEGNMPQIAVTSGSYDALECLLRGIGIDDKEFVMGHDDGGHVHVFRGSGGGMGTPAQDFWNDGAQLRKYDMVLLSCEASEHLENKGGSTPGARASMHEYLNAGGKVFATHYHDVWFKNSPAPEFTQLATWASSAAGGTSYDVNQSFPKGEKLAEWLHEIGASSTLGKISLEDEAIRATGVNEPAVAWITAPNGNPVYFTVNTPILRDDGNATEPEEQCGRAVVTGLHVVDPTDAAPTAINRCAIGSGGLNAQQKAVEFLFFDLSACVTDDKVEPQPPK